MAELSWIDRLRTLPARPAFEPWLASAGRLGRFFLLTLGRAHRDGVILTSAALAYVTILSMIPLLAAFSFVGARVFTAYQERSLEFFVQVLPYHEATVTDQLEQFLGQARELEGWSILVFFGTALFAFGTVEETINRIWAVSRRRPFRVRFLSFTLLVFWGPVLIGASYSAFLILRQRFGREILESSVTLNLLPLLGTLVGLSMLYWLVPYTAVSFRNALAGGLGAAILLELLRLSFGLYVGLLVNPTAVYGRFAFALFFAASIQASWAIVLYGSELAYCAQHYGALARGIGATRRHQDRWLGLAAALALAESFDRGRPRTEENDLADRLLVPTDSLEPILEPLVEAGILEPTEGREREYLLGRPPHKLRVESVLAAYDAGAGRLFEPLRPGLRAELGRLAERVAEARREGLAELTLADLVAEGGGGEGARPGEE
ncbi:MAG TPA: YhjD/YihY/BrkB family envelope integrity protein [Thermoanaerobaculia bacterium]|nr:YhjD/YihY/BrkB family envelope integrity protein [Thermoanaerobaculia bacterium]